MMCQYKLFNHQQRTDAPPAGSLPPVFLKIQYLISHDVKVIDPDFGMSEEEYEGL
jgi:hypothetical protein